MTETPPANSYDAAPYPRLSHYFTHPDKAAALAILLGLSPPPVEHCRVLELGCASGDNLIPMAQALPQNQFVGLDLSGRQVAEGGDAVAGDRHVGAPGRRPAAVQHLPAENQEVEHVSATDEEQSDFSHGSTRIYTE